MFNRYNINAYPREVNVRVKEERAPTDDSIRLYGEMRDKVIADILAAGRESVGVGDFQWVAIRMPEIMGLRIAFSLVVNGELCSEEIDIDGMTVAMAGRSPELQCRKIEEIVLAKVHELVSRKILASMFTHMAGEISWSLMVGRGD